MGWHWNRLFEDIKINRPSVHRIEGELSHSLLQFHVGLIDVIFALGTGEDHLPRSKNQDRFYQRQVLVNHTRKVFIFHHVSLLTKLRYVDPETDVCIGHDVCYSKFCHFGIHPHGLRDILDSLPGRILSVAFRLRTDYNHPTRLETQNCAFWSSLSHYNSRETFPVVSRTFHFFSDLFEV